MAIEQLHPAVYKIDVPFGPNAMVYVYLLRGARLALVDTGVFGSPDTVLRNSLAEIGVTLSQISIILNTHAHLDHLGGNLPVKRQSDARIHLHAADVPLAESIEAEVEYHVAPLRALGFPPDAIRDRAIHVRENVVESAGVDIPLSDGDRVDLGEGLVLRVIHCPGHTPGQVAYWWEQEGMLFTGDAIQCHGSRPGGYPLYHDAPAYRHSLDKLLRLDCQTLCLGHAYHGGTIINHPVRRGSEVETFIRASQVAADTLHRITAEAVSQKPGAGRREIAFAALDALLYEIPQLRVRRTGMPILAGPTLLAHIESALAGTYPG